MSDVNGQTPPPPAAATAARSLRADTSDLKSSYCNVCNVNGTREEIVLNFGVNHDWDRSQNGDVRLLHRIILSPAAAKRVAALLSQVMADFESRHGSLK